MNERNVVISILRGIVASVGLDHIDIVVGGLGLRVHVTPAFAQGREIGRASCRERV